MHLGWLMQGYRKGVIPFRDKFLRGFTLVEILLVTVTLSIIALAVYTTFDNGIKLWKKMTQDVLQEDINIFFSKISDDLRNSFRYSGIEFSGSEDSIAFAIPIKFIIQGKVENGIGQAGYFFDKRTNSINRIQTNYSQLYLDKSGPVRQLVNDIKSLNFQYYCYDPRQEEYLWVDAWNEEQVPLEIKIDEHLPLAVKIEVESDDNNESGKFTKVVTIPVGR